MKLQNVFKKYSDVILGTILACSLTASHNEDLAPYLPETFFTPPLNMTFKARALGKFWLACNNDRKERFEAAIPARNIKRLNTAGTGASSSPITARWEGTIPYVETFDNKVTPSKNKNESAQQNAQQKKIVKIAHRIAEAPRGLGYDLYLKSPGGDPITSMNFIAKSLERHVDAPFTIFAPDLTNSGAFLISLSADHFVISEKTRVSLPYNFSNIYNAYFTASGYFVDPEELLKTIRRISNTIGERPKIRDIIDTVEKEVTTLTKAEKEKNQTELQDNILESKRKAIKLGVAFEVIFNNHDLSDKCKDHLQKIWPRDAISYIPLSGRNHEVRQLLLDIFGVTIIDDSWNSQTEKPIPATVTSTSPWVKYGSKTVITPQPPERY